jgi:hypothetical protein
MKKPKPVRLHWITVPLEMARVIRGDLSILLVIARVEPELDQYSLTALQAPVDAQSPEDVFASHSHASLGIFEGRAAVLAAAQNYAQSWKAGQQPSVEPCGCGEITTLSVSADASAATGGDFTVPVDDDHGVR